MARTTSKKLTVNEALAKALADATEPMKAKDVIERALPLTSLNTKTPKATIAHALSVEARKESGLFERTGTGMYLLRQQEVVVGVAVTEPEAEAKPDPKPARARSTSARKNTRKRETAAAA